MDNGLDIGQNEGLTSFSVQRDVTICVDYVHEAKYKKHPLSCFKGITGITA